MTCRRCNAELEGTGCPACNPPIDLDTFAKIEQHPLWETKHRVGSGRGRFMFIFAAMIGGVLALAYPSYAEAVDGGDTSGRPLMIGGAIAIGFFTLLGVYYSFLSKLERHAAIVLTTARQQGVDTPHHFLHARTRARPLLLRAETDITQLVPGQPIIVFERSGFAEAIWTLD